MPLTSKYSHTSSLPPLESHSVLSNHTRTFSLMSENPSISRISVLKQRFQLPEVKRKPKPSNPRRKKPQFHRLSRAKLLPVKSRRDPHNYPPTITESDVQDGMLKLLYKGMIPKNADLSPAFGAHLGQHRRRGLLSPLSPSPVHK